MVLTGVILSATVSKKWLFLPALAAGFLARFAMQNGSTLFGGMRTRAEITREKTGLEQVLKGRGNYNGVKNINCNNKR